MFIKGSSLIGWLEEQVRIPLRLALIGLKLLRFVSKTLGPNFVKLVTGQFDMSVPIIATKLTIKFQQTRKWVRCLMVWESVELIGNLAILPSTALVPLTIKAMQKAGQ